MPIDLKNAQRIDEFFDKEKFATHYDKTQLEDIKSKLLRHFETDPNEDAINARLDLVKEIGLQHNIANRHYENVRRQEHEIRRYELKPGQDHVSELADQIKKMVPFKQNSPWWREKFAGYGDRVPFFLSSVAGGSKEAVSWVQNNNRPIIHQSAPSNFDKVMYRNLVMDAKVTSLDEVRVADKRMEMFLDSGRDSMTKDDARKVMKRAGPVAHRVQNLTEAATAGLLAATNAAGKGILSHSKASEDDRYKKYLAQKNAMIAQMMWTLGSDSRYGTRYLQALQKINEAMSGSGELLDEARFRQLQEAIDAEILKTEGDNKKQMEAFNESISTLNTNMLNGLQKHVDNEDDMWKYRMVQVLLILTPLGGLSLFGGFMSYIEPLANLLGPVFSSGLSFGEGVGSIVTSDVFGPLGDLCEKIHLDEGIAYLLDNVPVLDQFGQVVDGITDNPIAQNLMGAVSPLLSSPLIPLGIAGVYSLFRLDTEVAHYSKVSDFRKEQSKQLERKFEDFHKEVVGDKLKEKIAGFSKIEVDGCRKSSINAQLAEFISKCDNDEISEIFKNLKLKVDKDPSNKVEKTLPELQLAGFDISSPSTILNLLYNSSEATRANFVNRFLLFKAVDSEHKTSAEVLRDFQDASTSPKVDDLIKKEQEKVDQQYLFNVAQKGGLITVSDAEKLAQAREKLDDVATPKEEKEKLRESLNKEATTITKQIIMDRAEHHYHLERSQSPNHPSSVLPSPLVSNASAEVLGAAARSRALNPTR